MAYTFGSSRPLSLGDKLWRVHWPVILTAAAIASIGAAALYSVSGGSFQPWAERHALRFLIAVAIVLAMAMVRPELWLRLAYPAYGLALAALALVPVLGVEALGAKRWLGVGGMTFQPSELMKLALVGALARYYQWLPIRAVIASCLGPRADVDDCRPCGADLAPTRSWISRLVCCAGLALMFMAGVSIFYFLAGLGGVVAAMPLIWNNMHDYQRRRVEIFLDPDLDPLGSGYHIAQSKIAIGSGGVSGKGFLQGTQSQLDFVPEKHTDFILTILGEEWGFAGLLVLLGLYALLLVMMLSMAWRCQSRFGRMLIAGVTVSLFVYVFINVAMVTGLVPVVGIPLPLVSYGGTSMMTLMIGLGLAMSAYVHRDENIRRKEIGLFW